MGHLIGTSSLDGPVPLGVATKPRDHERHLRAELGPDFLVRIVSLERPARDGTPEDRHPAGEGLLRRLARVVGIL